MMSFVLGLLVMVALCVLPNGAALADGSVPSGRIAFASDRLAPNFGNPGLDCLSAHCDDIYVVNPDGSGLRTVTPTSLTGFEGSPTWSPDGTKIAFYRTFKGFQGEPSHQIYVINSDGSGLTQLTTGTQLSVLPAWSPDGTKIAFVRRSKDGNKIGPGHIALMNPDGSSVVLITSGPDGDFRPSWSPDSSRIAFDRNCAIYTINRDGTGLTKLISKPGCVGDAAWSPNGTKIAFWNFDLSALQSFDLRTKKVSTVATGAQLGDDPSAERLAGWSPDGQWLAVGACCDISGGVGMVLVSGDGSTIAPVPNGGYAMAPAWHA